MRPWLVLTSLCHCISWGCSLRCRCSICHQTPMWDQCCTTAFFLTSVSSQIHLSTIPVQCCTSRNGTRSCWRRSQSCTAKTRAQLSLWWLLSWWVWWAQVCSYCLDMLRLVSLQAQRTKCLSTTISPAGMTYFQLLLHHSRRSRILDPDPETRSSTGGIDSKFCQKIPASGTETVFSKLVSSSWAIWN